VTFYDDPLLCFAVNFLFTSQYLLILFFHGSFFLPSSVLCPRSRSAFAALASAHPFLAAESAP